MATARWERALVIGASSGTGEALARALGAQGSKVALIARRGEALQRVVDDINEMAGQERAFPYVYDVRHAAGVEPLFQEIATTLGGLDLVIYAAGILPRVGPDEYATDTDVSIIETNFVGAVAWLNEAAHRFGRARRGTIVGISSVAGDRGRRGNPAYNASKAALSSYLESLRNRLAVRGVTVMTAKPGYVQTPMLEGSEKPALVPAVAPEQAAHQILEAAAARRRIVYVPAWWRPIMLVTRAIPPPIFEKLNL